MFLCKWRTKVLNGYRMKKQTEQNRIAVQIRQIVEK